MIELLEFFEDEKNYYAVTKFVPSGDLNMYVMRNWKCSAVPESTVRLILR